MRSSCPALLNQMRVSLCVVRLPSHISREERARGTNQSGAIHGYCSVLETEAIVDLLNDTARS